VTEPVESTSEARSAAPSRGRSPRVAVVLGAVIAGLLIWFALANLQEVKIDFWIKTTKAPLIEVIVISGLLGGLVGGLVRRLRRPPSSRNRRA
jgi:uncharacterized integral membrane protein